MALLLKAIYKFKEVPIKFTTQLFIELERAILKFTWNNKKRITKNILNKKMTSVGISVSDHKQCYRAIVIKSAQYW